MNTSPIQPETYHPHWVSRAAFPLISGLLFLTQGVLIWSVSQQLWWLAVPLVVLVSHFMHGQLIGFHEASHRMLRKSRVLNEIDGSIIGALSFIPFTLYRASHQTHHMHLGTEKDEEMWPFNKTEVPRWQRVIAAFLELTFGVWFTPFLFFRTFFRKNSPIRAQRVRRRIWWEIGLMVVVWTSMITLVAVFDVWTYFLWAYFVPAWLAGNMQSVRKYIEHVGLTGATTNSATRNIIAGDVMGKIISVSLLHEPYHGVHHLHSGVAHAHLPAYADELQARHPDEVEPFPSYWSAFLHLAKSLPNPKVGAHWRSGAGDVSALSGAGQLNPS